MSNCPFADQDIKYRAAKTNYTPGRKVDGVSYKIDTITLHCVWGHLSKSTLASQFQKKETSASSNYGIMDDGEIVMFVEEADRSWCSSWRYNDVRAVTVEMNSDKDAACTMLEPTVEGAIKLCADVCQRNGIKKMNWFPNLVPYPRPRGNDQKQANSDAIQAKRDTLGKDEGIFTVHRWFEDKSCPGDYLFNRMTEICSKVNAILNGENQSKLVIKAGNQEREITGVQLRNREGIATGVMLMGVKGAKYMTFNAFRNTEWLSSEMPDKSDTKAVNNTDFNNRVAIENAYLFRSNLRCYTADKKDIITKNPMKVVTAYLFSDCQYEIAFKVDYSEQSGGSAYPSVSVYARSSKLASAYGASDYADWKRIYNGTVTPTGNYIDCDVVGYIRNQKSKVDFYDDVFRPRFQIRLGKNVNFRFDFDDYVLKEDLSATYMGIYPRVSVYGDGGPISKDTADMVINLRADVFTPIDKLY